MLCLVRGREGAASDADGVVLAELLEVAHGVDHVALGLLETFPGDVVAGAARERHVSNVRFPTVIFSRPSTRKTLRRSPASSAATSAPAYPLPSGSAASTSVTVPAPNAGPSRAVPIVSGSRPSANTLLPRTAPSWYV